MTLFGQYAAAVDAGRLADELFERARVADQSARQGFTILAPGPCTAL